MNTSRPPALRIALDIVGALRARGHIAYFAGGCVRDKLLDRPPKDYDVVTDATPDQVRLVFPRARLVGAQFGVVLVRKHRIDVEVATFRTDGTYRDGRHPANVTFGSEIEDAKRRDFTINGLYLDPFEDRIIDHVGGQADLAAGCLRTIGEADQRFAEDHLRMMRAVRLAARLNFRIAPETMEAIGRLAGNLRAISPERVWMELEEILTLPTRANGWHLLVACELVAHIAPPWRPSDAVMGLIERRLAALPDHPVDPALALATLLVDGDRKETKAFCDHLRLSNRDRHLVLWLTRQLAGAGDPGALPLADLKLLMVHDGWPLLGDLLLADLKAKDLDLGPHKQLLARAGKIPTERVDPPPLLTGDDLLARGATSGPALGRVLADLRRAQLSEELTDPAEAMRLACERLGL